MNIYVGHSNDFDFKTKLYKPLRESELNTKFSIALPHETSDNPFNSREYLKKCGLFIAEVSSPSTGLGIELGWANFLHVPVICIYRKNSKVSGSLRVITDAFIEYENEEDLIEKLSYMINHFYA